MGWSAQARQVKNSTWLNTIMDRDDPLLFFFLISKRNILRTRENLQRYNNPDLGENKLSQVGTTQWPKKLPKSKNHKKLARYQPKQKHKAKNLEHPNAQHLSRNRGSKTESNIITFSCKTKATPQAQEAPAQHHQLGRLKRTSSKPATATTIQRQGKSPHSRTPLSATLPKIQHQHHHKYHKPIYKTSPPSKIDLPFTTQNGLLLDSWSSYFPYSFNTSLKIHHRVLLQVTFCLYPKSYPPLNYVKQVQFFNLCV